ncbi:chemotaxis protein CheW [Desulfovibrio inopinatus]|uniref:chemotaxis protein CheW n=1 Tax=Desulfovibrio inopinatus TaxID=102109 RepID=UPI0004091074|nr:chemotaxis protein CheW [Desulfovibrio inopinatus]
MAASERMDLNQYLTFTLSDELFAIDLLWVKEILDGTDLTHIPMAPDYIRGVINVRGNPVPVVDLRLTFNMAKTEMTVNTCVIICELAFDGEKSSMGFLADSVQEVLELRPDQIDPPPQMGTTIDCRRIKGMGKRDSQFIIILNMDEILSESESSEVQQTTSELATESVG